MNERDKDFFTAILDTPELPDGLEEAYDDLKRMADRQSVTLGPDVLVLLARNHMTVVTPDIPVEPELDTPPIVVEHGPADIEPEGERVIVRQGDGGVRNGVLLKRLKGRDRGKARVRYENDDKAFHVVPLDRIL